MIRAIAVDDEPLALEVIKKHAEKTDILQLEATFVNAFEAMDFLNEHDIDLLFLDIKMPDISGIDFYGRLTNKPLLVFTTAYPEHAVTGFELDAIDYLLKPFALDRFQKCCQKVLIQLESNPKTLGHIFIKDGYTLLKVYLKDILFLEATGNYIRYVLSDREILTRATIKETLQLLPPSIFFQTHRSFIVNKMHIDKIEKQQIAIQCFEIPIALSFAQQVKQVLNENQ